MEGKNTKHSIQTLATAQCWISADPFTPVALTGCCSRSLFPATWKRIVPQISSLGKDWSSKGDLQFSIECAFRSHKIMKPKISQLNHCMLGPLGTDFWNVKKTGKITISRKKQKAKHIYYWMAKFSFIIFLLIF